MNQLATSFATEPQPDTDCARVLNALRQGNHLTMKAALLTLGVGALSQRCGELRRLGWDVQSRTIKTEGKGARVSEYWL